MTVVHEGWDRWLKKGKLSAGITHCQKEICQNLQQSKFIVASKQELRCLSKDKKIWVTKEYFLSFSLRNSILRRSINPD